MSTSCFFFYPTWYNFLYDCSITGKKEQNENTKVDEAPIKESKRSKTKGKNKKLLEKCKGIDRPLQPSLKP